MHKRFVHLYLFGMNESGWKNKSEREIAEKERTIEMTSKNFAWGVNEILDILSWIFFFHKIFIQMVLVPAEFLSFDYP